MSWYKKITIEVPVLLCFFSFLLAASITTNFIYYRTCYTILGQDEVECRKLGQLTEKGETSQLEIEVQKSANIIVMVSELPPALLPVIINMFAGSWSDRYGRKPVLIMVMGGLTVSLGLFGVMVFFRNLSPWAFLLASIPSMLTGSSTTYFTITLAYLNDICTPENRGLRMAIYETTMVVGMFLGTFSSSYILYATSYETCYLLASGLIGLALLYAIFVLPESLDPKSRETNKKNIKSAFQFRNLTDNFKTAFRKRQNYNRALLLLVIAILTLTFFIAQGERGIKFPFCKFGGSHMVISILGVYLLHHKLKIGGAVLGLLGLISMALGSFLLGFTVNDFYVYGAVAVGVFGGLTTPMLRTEVGHIIPADEMGKVFGLISTLQGITTIAGSFLYTYFYNATIDINTALYNFISFGLYTLGVFFVLIIIILQKRLPPKENTEVTEPLSTIEDHPIDND